VRPERARLRALYRHGDNDFIRSARQQDFLRQAKEQIGIGKLFGDRTKLLEIFGAYTQTDIHSNAAILRLLKLAFESAKNPIQQITFRAGEENTATAAYVVASQDQINKTVQDFPQREGVQEAEAEAQAAGQEPQEAQPEGGGGRVPGPRALDHAVEDQAIKLQLKAGFNVYWPKLTLNTGRYSDTPSKDNPMQPRAYSITDRNGNHYRAYRMTVDAGGFGQYYGIQGTKWAGPPILDNPDGHLSMRGRKYDLFYDGGKLRLVAWRSGNASYWVSNTLSESLSNKQMLGIARSLTRVGR